MTLRSSRPRSWLEATPLLDLTHPHLRETLRRVTRWLPGAREQALAIHSFVRLLPFGSHGSAGPRRASRVLELPFAGCQDKGTLFVALCRAAGIPARLQFVRLPGSALHGLAGQGVTTWVHAVGEVRLGQAWLCTDGYVLDPALFAQARLRLCHAGRRAGWGLHRDAPALWDARGDCLQQYAAGDGIDHYGAFDDPADFRAQHATPVGLPRCLAPWDGWVDTGLTNHRVLRLRYASAPVATARDWAGRYCNHLQRL